MAGRPTAGSTTGIIVGMCVGIGIAVIALVFLVILWTKQEDLVAQAKSKTDEANRVMSSSERTGALRGWYDKAGRQSAASLMAQELGAFAELVNGDDAAVEPDYVAGLQDEGGELSALWNRLEADDSIPDAGAVIDQPLVAALRSMYDLYKQANDRADQLQASLDSAHAERDQCTADKTALQEEFTRTADELTTKVTEIETEVGSSRDAQVAMLDELKAKSAERAEENQQLRLEMSQELDQQKQRLAETEAAKRQLQERVREFQVQPKSGGRARQTDGEIVLATSGSDAVFINLGSKDKMILGLRFAVYQAYSEIPASGEAKGAIEVIGIGEDASECRILWANPSYPMIAGDTIANPIYDRHRSLVFMTIGAFDFDYDGLDDINGPETVEAIIKEGGGTLVSELTARVDFLIVGAQPLVREPGKSATPEATALYEDDLDALRRYASAFELARSLSVPMLTQETFLNFMGRRN